MRFTQKFVSKQKHSLGDAFLLNVRRLVLIPPPPQLIRPTPPQKKRGRGVGLHYTGGAGHGPWVEVTAEQKDQKMRVDVTMG